MTRLWCLLVLAGTLLLASSSPGHARPEPELSARSAAAETARNLLPPRFLEYETRRFIVFSDAEPRWTQEQAGQLERAHHQFLRFCRRLGLEPAPLEHKLVAIAFRQRDEYRAFGRDHDDVDVPALAGYYSPRHDRVVFYHVESNPSVGDAREKLAGMRDEIRNLERRLGDAVRHGQSDQADSLRGALTQYRAHLNVQQRRVDAFTVDAITATTVHEAIHQLLFHTGIQSRHVEYPLWISEGLATTFEVGHTRQAFGPDHEYAPRREEFELLRADGELLPLRTLVPLTRVTDEDARHVVYHQSYALVTWMSRFRARQLAAYLSALAADESGQPTERRHLELFEKAFGDVDRVESAWLKHEEGRDRETRGSTDRR